jgi:hypothetical protein
MKCLQGILITFKQEWDQLRRPLVPMTARAQVRKEVVFGQISPLTVDDG